MNRVPKSLADLVPIESFIGAWRLMIQRGKAKPIIEMVFQSLTVAPFRSSDGVVKRMRLSNIRQRVAL